MSFRNKQVAFLQRSGSILSNTTSLFVRGLLCFSVQIFTVRHVMWDDVMSQQICWDSDGIFTFSHDLEVGRYLLTTLLSFNIDFVKSCIVLFSEREMKASYDTGKSLKFTFYFHHLCCIEVIDRSIWQLCTTSSTLYVCLHQTEKCFHDYRYYYYLATQDWQQPQTPSMCKRSLPKPAFLRKVLAEVLRPS